MKLTRSFSFFFLLLIVTTIFNLPIGRYRAFASSPSFPFQEIADPLDGWSLIKARQNFQLIKTPDNTIHMIKLGKNDTECIIGQQQHAFQIPPSISAVTYLSNGKTLNATLC
jgi:hypothetical protein